MQTQDYLVSLERSRPRLFLEVTPYVIVYKGLRYFYSNKTPKHVFDWLEGNDDSRLAKLYEARRADDYRDHLPRGDAVQVFRMRVNHVLLLASMSKRGWSQSAPCRLCGNRVEDVDHVLFDCPALEDCRSPGWGCQNRSQVLWAERSVLVEAAMLLRVFLRKTKEREAKTHEGSPTGAKPTRSNPWPGDVPAQDEHYLRQWPRFLVA